MPVRNTTGNSSPLAVCKVISVTTPSRLASATAASMSAPGASGIWSASATRDTCSRKAPRLPSGFSCSYSRTTATSSARFSTRDSSCGSVLQRGEVAGLFKDRFECRGSPGPGGHLGEVVQHFHEAQDGVDRTGGHARSLVRAAGGRHEGRAFAAGEGRHGAFGTVPDAPFGFVQHPAEVDVVVRVHQDTQVREG